MYVQACLNPCVPSKTYVVHNRSELKDGGPLYVLSTQTCSRPLWTLEHVAHYPLVPDTTMLPQIVEPEGTTRTSIHETPRGQKKRTRINTRMVDPTRYSIYKYDLPCCINHAHLLVPTYIKFLASTITSMDSHVFFFFFNVSSFLFFSFFYRKNTERTIPNNWPKWQSIPLFLKFFLSGSSPN